MPSLVSSPQSVVSADYASPSATQSFQYQQTSLSSQPSVPETTAYLAGLRKTLSHMQGDVNAFLTSKMEADKREAAGPAANNGTIVDEDKKEDNYGEEADDDS